MQARILHLLIAATVIVAELPLFWATYECSMTGERQSGACCCAGAGACEDAATAPERGGSLRGLCCSRTSHRLPAPSTGDLSSRGNPWRQPLDEARLTACFCDLILAAPEPALAAPGQWSPALARRGPACTGELPLYLAHRALLI